MHEGHYLCFTRGMATTDASQTFTTDDFVSLTEQGAQQDILATINAGPASIRAHWADLGAIWAEEIERDGGEATVPQLDTHEAWQVADAIAASWGLVQGGEIDGWPVYRIAN